MQPDGAAVLIAWSASASRLDVSASCTQHLSAMGGGYRGRDPVLGRDVAIKILLDSLQLAPFEYDHLFYEPRGSRGERLAVGRYLIGDQGDVLVPFLSDEGKNV